MYIRRCFFIQDWSSIASFLSVIHNIPTGIDVRYSSDCRIRCTPIPLELYSCSPIGGPVGVSNYGDEAWGMTTCGIPTLLFPANCNYICLWMWCITTWQPLGSCLLENKVRSDCACTCVRIWAIEVKISVEETGMSQSVEFCSSIRILLGWLPPMWPGMFKGAFFMKSCL